MNREKLSLLEAVLALAPMLVELTPKVIAFGQALIARRGGLSGSS